MIAINDENIQGGVGERSLRAIIEQVGVLLILA